MIPYYRIALSLVLGVFILCGPVASQTRGAPDYRCFKHDVVSTAVETTLRSAASTESSVAKVVPANTQFQVLGSQYIKTSISGCWIRTADGWLQHSNSSRPTTTSTAKATSASCYPHSQAYLTGGMNIRQKSTTASGIAGTTIKRNAYAVLGTYQGVTYCWLRIDEGWIARINSVSSDIVDILPVIEGEGWFKDIVKLHYEFLLDKSPRLFNETNPKINVIKQVENINIKGEKINARIIVKTRELSISEAYITSERAMVASTLVHEACHVEQWDRGDRYLLTFLAEPECYAAQAEALAEIAPRHRNIRALRCWARHYPSTFLCEYEYNLRG